MRAPDEIVIRFDEADRELLSRTLRAIEALVSSGQCLVRGTDGDTDELARVVKVLEDFGYCPLPEKGGVADEVESVCQLAEQAAKAQRQGGVK